MNIGDTISWVDREHINRSGSIYKTNPNGGIDVLLFPERNVLFESLYKNITTEDPISKGSIVIYKKNGYMYEALVLAVDWPSKSAQIQVILRDLYFP